MFFHGKKKKNRRAKDKWKTVKIFATYIAEQ